MQRKFAQIAQTNTNSQGTTDHNHIHMMDGLVDQLVDAFENPRKRLTTRGVAREKGVAETFVVTALFRDLRRELNELRGQGYGRRAA